MTETLISRDEPYAEERRQMEQAWEPVRGFWAWVSETHHKPIGRRYIITALIFFAIAGVEAALMRFQLSRPENSFVTNDFYNQLFTMHGTTMMFLFAVPIMEGMAVYFVPLMIGTRDMAFPKLNAYGYFVYLFGGIFIYTMFALKAGPDAGWFSYVPLSGPQFDPGKRVDTWAQMITFTELSGLIVAVEVVVTAFKCRAPGMSLNRIPLFVWSMIVISFMIMFAMPAVMLDSGMLCLDREVSTHFFNRPEGGDPLYYQHMFWFFGHPEVYIIFIPALGYISSILTTFTRRKIFGYPVMVASLVFTGFMGFGLWVHHMFVTGLPQLGQSFFSAASMMIAIPTGVQIFCWIVTIWLGKLTIRTPVLYVFGFFFNFTIGGLTGVMLASVPLDSQLHDTMFVVAHFHYVLIGGALFPLFGAFYYWFPKWTGRMSSERLGRLSFWLLFVGFNVTFFPLHYLGILGMPRRVYTYQQGLGWGPLNALASAGAVIIVLSVLTTLANFVMSARTGAVAGDNPWAADTLEWSIASPPPDYNFLHLPVVSGPNALWDAAPDQPYVVGQPYNKRELLITRVLDAQPDHREELPDHSFVPFILAVVTCVSLWGAIFYAWWFTFGYVAAGIVMIFWFWPPKKKMYEDLARERPDILVEEAGV
jgi:cytochrome c oxidase subunit I